MPCTSSSPLASQSFTECRADPGPIPTLRPVAFQTAAQLQPLFPGLPDVEAVSSITIPTSVLTCAFRSFTVYHRFYVYMLLPALALPHGLLLLWIDATTLCRGDVERMAMHPSQRRKVMQRSFTRGKRWWQLVTTCFVVVVFVLYPTLIKQIAWLNDCKRYDFGGTKSESGVSAPHRTTPHDMAQHDTAHHTTPNHTPVLLCP